MPDLPRDPAPCLRSGEREVKLALRKTLCKYRLHQDQELFDRAYAYIRQHY